MTSSLRGKQTLTSDNTSPDVEMTVSSIDSRDARSSSEKQAQCHLTAQNTMENDSSIYTLDCLAPVESSVSAHSPDVALDEPPAESSTSSSCCQSRLCREIKEQLKVAIPATLGSIAFTLVQSISIGFVGHLGENELAASAIATLYCNVFGHAPISGYLTALDTLASQAYGAGNFKRVGLAAQTALWASVPLVAVVVVLWLLVEPVLRGVGISGIVAAMAGKFTYVCLFALPGSIVGNVMRKYLNAQRIAVATMIATVTGVLIAAPLNYVFIHILGLGYLGAAWTTVIYSSLIPFILLAYIRFYGLHVKTWPGWSLVDWRDLGTFVRLGLPGIGMTCAEWCGLEAHTFLAGLLGTAYAGAQAVLVNLMFLLYMTPMGLSISANARVGAALGANDPAAARYATRVAVFLGFVAEVATVFTLALAYRNVGALYTSAPDVLEVFNACVPIFLFVAFFDGIQGSMSGAMRACGQQVVGLVSNLCAYWLLALPIGYALAFHAGSHPDYEHRDDAGVPLWRKGMGSQGQWIGLITASLLVTIVYAVYLLRLDWVDMAKRVSDRERERERESAGGAQGVTEDDAAGGIGDEELGEAGGRRTGTSGDDDFAEGDDGNGNASNRVLLSSDMDSSGNTDVAIDGLNDQQVSLDDLLPTTSKDEQLLKRESSVELASMSSSTPAARKSGGG